MSQVITKRTRLSRRTVLKGLVSNAAVIVGLPPLVSMFNSAGTAYAAQASPTKQAAPIERRFVLWFNGNGIPERYWIPETTGTDYEITPCLSPLARLHDQVHVIRGLDNVVQGGLISGHETAMSALMTCTRYSGRGPGGPSVDQIVARKFGGENRFKSLQIGVSQESFGTAMHKNMSWAGVDRPLPPEEIPHRLFDRLFGAKDTGWVNRKKSILDAVYQDANYLSKTLPKEDVARLDEHLSSVRDLEHSITSLPPEYSQVTRPDEDFDMKDWPRVAKIQSDLLAYAFATQQTRVASYMLTKCQGLARFPWLGHNEARHHDYTHADGKAPGADRPAGQRVLRDICRWHVEEFAYLTAKLQSIPEGAGTVLDNTVLTYVHEHAEANPHKATGMIALVAGSSDKLKHGRHTKIMGNFVDLYSTIANNVLNIDLGKDTFPASSRNIGEILA